MSPGQGSVPARSSAVLPGRQGEVTHTGMCFPLTKPQILKYLSSKEQREHRTLPWGNPPQQHRPAGGGEERGAVKLK